MSSAESHTPAMTPQQAKFASGSGFLNYKEISVGKDGTVLDLIAYELSTVLFSNLPGILGYGARSIIYPLLLGASGHRPAFGRGVVLRNPKKISLGNKVLIDDYAVLDVRGEASLRLGNYVSVGRFTTLAAKGGRVELADGCNIGSYCRIATQSNVEFGESVLVGAYTYIGPGNHKAGDGELPLISREMDIKGGVKIGSHVWIGAGVTILDGVTIGERAIVGAHSLVINDVPPGAKVAGTPAKILGT